MKRKTKTGVKLLTQVIDRMRPTQGTSPSQTKQAQGADYAEKSKGKGESDNNASAGKISRSATSQKSQKSKAENNRAGSRANA